jgi:hypothetical protein
MVKKPIREIGSTNFPSNAEVIRPLIAARVKERDEVAGCRIHGGNIRSLALITKHAGKGQIIQGGRSAMFLANNVVNLMRKTGVVFGNQAVFATMICAAGNRGPPLPGDSTGHSQESTGLLL